MQCLRAFEVLDLRADVLELRSAAGADAKATLRITDEPYCVRRLFAGFLGLGSAARVRSDSVSSIAAIDRVSALEVVGLAIAVIAAICVPPEIPKVWRMLWVQVHDTVRHVDFMKANRTLTALWLG